MLVGSHEERCHRPARCTTSQLCTLCRCTCVEVHVVGWLPMQATTRGSIALSNAKHEITTQFANVCDAARCGASLIGLELCATNGRVSVHGAVSQPRPLVVASDVTTCSNVYEARPATVSTR